MVYDFKKDSCLIISRYVGINASDVNYTAARYDPGVKVPFDCGFEVRFNFTYFIYSALLGL